MKKTELILFLKNELELNSFLFSLSNEVKAYQEKVGRKGAVSEIILINDTTEKICVSEENIELLEKNKNEFPHHISYIADVLTLLENVEFKTLNLIERLEFLIDGDA